MQLPPISPISPISLISPIPLLVREKVYFYYDLAKWKEQIKIMHQQYHKKLQIYDDGMLDTIEWRHDDHAYYTGYANTICSIAGKSHRWGLYKHSIKEFYDRRELYVNDQIACLPLKYHYSSGLDHPQAFKQN